jgi:two-component system nitrate/nitrite response regulator NarL
VTITQQRAREELVVIRSAVPPAPAATRVLVALSQQLFSEVLEAALADGSSCQVSSSPPRHVISSALRFRPDAVLLDVDADNTDATTVIRDLRRLLPGTAVLVLSASPSATLLSEVMTAGAAGFLSFDSDMAEVLAAVESAAAGQVVLSGRRLEALVRHLTHHAVPRQPSGPGGRLTDREVQVLSLLVAGASTTTIASTLFVSAHTARTHIQNVLAKLDVHSRLEAAAYAVQHGLVEAYTAAG